MVPALLITISGTPKVSTQAFTIALTESAFATSQVTAFAFAPSALATRSPAAAFKSAMMTFAPSRI